MSKLTPDEEIELERLLHKKYSSKKQLPVKEEKDDLTEWLRKYKPWPKPEPYISPIGTWPRVYPYIPNPGNPFNPQWYPTWIVYSTDTTDASNKGKASESII